MRGSSHSPAPGAGAEVLSSFLSGGVVRDVLRAYTAAIPRPLRIIDAFLLYTLYAGIVQIVYAAAVGTFPFNAFLAGLLSCVSLFVLTVSLRLQLNPANARDAAWARLPPQRAYADWLACVAIVLLACLNFLG